MVAANIVYIAREFHAHDYSNYSAVIGALVLNAVYHIICAMVGVSYIQSLNEIVSNDKMVIPSYTKSPPYEQTERNDGYVMMAYIPNSEDPPSYSENRDDDQWIIIFHTDWKKKDSVYINIGGRTNHGIFNVKFSEEFAYDCVIVFALKNELVLFKNFMKWEKSERRRKRKEKNES